MHRRYPEEVHAQEKRHPRRPERDALGPSKWTSCVNSYLRLRDPLRPHIPMSTIL